MTITLNSDTIALAVSRLNDSVLYNIEGQSSVIINLTQVKVV